MIAGTHGKTTTTSLTGWLLTHGGADPSVLVGGVAKNFGEHGSSYRIGGGREFVIEGDEYDSAFFDKTAKFLKYLPDIAVVNNVEFDHADIYADFEAVALAFRRLVNLVPRQGPPADRRRRPGRARADGARGRLAGRDVRPRRRTSTGRRTTWLAGRDRPRFKVRRSGSPFGQFEVPLVGAHNVRNALAAIAVATEVGICAGAHRRGACDVCGNQAPSRSRWHRRRRDGVRRFRPPPDSRCRNACRAASVASVARIWAVFEPRSASSCRRVFQDDFARAFAGADEVLLAPVFRSKLPEAERLSVPELVRDLRARGQSAREADSLDGIVDTIAREQRAGRSGDRDVERRLRRHSRQAAGGPQRGFVNPFRIVAAGDSALVVEFEERIDPEVNAQAVALADRLRGDPFAGVRDVVPTYRSVAVYFDPLRTAHDALIARLEREAAAPVPPRHAAPDVLRLPVCYGGEFGPDLATVAAFGGISEPAVVDLHTKATYHVFMLGFARGLRTSVSSTGESPRRGAIRRASACRADRSGSPARRRAFIRPRRQAAGRSSGARRSCRSICRARTRFS